MARYLSRHAQWLGRCRFVGRLYDLGHYPAAVPGGRQRSRVLADLYRLNKPAALLRVLDRYEGCGPGRGHRAEYRRVLHPVQCDDGSRVSAWVYLYRAELGRHRVLRHGDYRRRNRSTSAAQSST